MNEFRRQHQHHQRVVFNLIYEESLVYGSTFDVLLHVERIPTNTKVDEIRDRRCFARGFASARWMRVDTHLCTLVAS